MNSENKISRAAFIKTGAVFGVAALMTACGEKPEKTQVYLEKTAQWLERTSDALEKARQNLEASQTVNAAIPSITPSPSKSELLTPSRAVSMEVKTPTLAFLKQDKKTLQEIRNTTGGEKIILEDALISYVIKIPRPYVSDAVYGVLAVNIDSKEKGVAVIENFDCGMEMLEENNTLGDPIGSDKSPAISGLWKPNTRFESIGGTMFVEPSLGTIAVVTGTKYQFEEDDQSISCPKKSVFSGAGEVPEILAREAGKLIRNLIEGFKEGYFEENK